MLERNSEHNQQGEMMRPIFFAVLIVLVTMTGWRAFAQENKGADQMRLEGGGQGSVPFPHHRHQTALGDCLVCHSFFDQEKGAITEAIADGRLVKKQVMNKLCIQCHRRQKQDGKPGGPLTCTQCHKKES